MSKYVRVMDGLKSNAGGFNYNLPLYPWEILENEKNHPDDLEEKFIINKNMYITHKVYIHVFLHMLYLC